MEEDQLGLLQVYTGDGKGKTTAALGLALRAWGRGLKVCMIQFMKKGEDYGEILALRKMEGVDLYQFGSDRLITKTSVHPEDIELAHRALALAEEALVSGEYDVIILDEINVALFFGLVSSVRGFVRYQKAQDGRRGDPDRQERAPGDHRGGGPGDSDGGGEAPL